MKCIYTSDLLYIYFLSKADKSQHLCLMKIIIILFYYHVLIL